MSPEDGDLMKSGRPFGTWASPLRASDVASGAMHLELVALDGGSLYWIERRPLEGGHQAVVRLDAEGTRTDMLPFGANARSRVHEYGGAPCAVDEGVVYYANYSDQRLYRVVTPGEASPLTPAGPWRYADISVDRSRRRLVCVREDHSEPERPPRNELVAIPLDGPESEGGVIASGYDFYSSPKLSPLGDRLAWICWRDPQMPWDGTELHMAALDATGRFTSSDRIAGGEREAIVQAMWSPDGVLHFVSDRSGWWNLYRHDSAGHIEALLPMEAEFGRPPWEFGLALWTFVDSRHMVGSYARDGVWRIATFDLDTRKLTTFEDSPEQGNVILADSTQAFVVARTPRAPDAVARIDLPSGVTTTLRAASPPLLETPFISTPVRMTFPTDDGETAKLFYYAPVNPDVSAVDGDTPPLIVIIHGGPTSAATTRLNLQIQFWTTRGFAVADVDHRGSTGFGRVFRERLNGGWGVVEVADCVNAARFLADQGLADRERLIIRGASAGGFTVLAALTFRAGVFKAGACYYGIGDLEALARDTHKFEARYTDRLIAPYPQRADLYRARSPIHVVERLSCPVIFFHGREDLAVPVNQAETMVEAMRRLGLRADLLVFDGEQHGFRKSETIERCLEAELRFYGDVFGFVPAPN